MRGMEKRLEVEAKKQCISEWQFGNNVRCAFERAMSSRLQIKALEQKGGLKWEENRGEVK